MDHPDHRLIFDVSFEKTLEILGEETVTDLVDVLFKHGPQSFFFDGTPKDKECWGETQWDADRHGHRVSVAAEKTEQDWTQYQERMRANGGDPGTMERIPCAEYTAPSVKAALAFVLAHELQHCNQHHHRFGKKFYGRPFQRYWDRPAEVDARRFVAEHRRLVLATIGEAPAVSPIEVVVDEDAEVLGVAEALSAAKVVSVQDIKDELRASRCLSPSNVSFVRRFIESKGGRIE